MRTFSTKNKKGGFLLVELIVSIFVFGIVMSISVGALLMAFDANKKTQSLKSVLNNLTVVLDTMTKTFAVGQYYYCGSTTSLQTHLDCPMNPLDETGWGTEVSFTSNEDLGGENGDGFANDIITYSFNPGDGSGGFIERTLYIDQSQTIGPIRMTAPEVNITSMKFFVEGSEPGTPNGVEYEQPKVLIFIQGKTQAGPRVGETDFTVQTMVTQRVPDF